MKKDTILLDYDGTIMNTNDLIDNSWRYTFQQITGSVPPDEIIRKTYGEMLADTMKKFFGGTPEEIEKYIKIYRSYHNDHYEKDICLFPGIREMIADLRAAGYRIGLVTSRLSASAYKGLKEFGIYNMFDGFVTADDTDAHKPDPEPVLLALRKLGRKPEQAVMLGDSWFDMECARRAGVLPILVGWSASYKYGAEKPGGEPEHVIDKAADMLPLMQRINGEEKKRWA